MVRELRNLEGSGDVVCGEAGRLSSSVRGPGPRCECTGRREQALVLAGQGFIFLRRCRCR